MLSQRLKHNNEIDITPTKTLRLASLISLKLHLYIFSTTAVPDSGANANNYLCYTYVHLNGASGGSNHRVSDGFGVAASFAFSGIVSRIVNISFGLLMSRLFTMTFSLFSRHSPRMSNCNHNDTDFVHRCKATDASVLS